MIETAMNPHESDSPETDLFCKNLKGDDWSRWQRTASFAADLERQRNKAKKLLSQLLDAENKFGDGASMCHPRITMARSAARKFLEKH